MIPTWKDVHLAIRDLEISSTETDQLLYATANRIVYPLNMEDLLTFFTQRHVPDPLGNTDDAICWVDRLVPNAHVSIRNRARDGLWGVTITCTEAGAKAQAFARSLPLAIVKAAVEARADLDVLGVERPFDQSA
jgi:hypothetical protein